MDSRTVHSVMSDRGQPGFPAIETAPAFEQLRLDRLFELRAVVDSLRKEHRRRSASGSCTAWNSDDS